MLQNIIPSMEDDQVSEPEAKQLHEMLTHRQFSKKYDELVAGLNRIRYIKTKQQRNRTKILQYFNRLSKSIEGSKENRYQSATKLSNSLRSNIQNFDKGSQLKQIKKIFKNCKSFEPRSKIANERSYQKLMNYSFQRKSNNHCLESKPTQITIQNRSLMDMSLSSNKQKLAYILSKKKAENYQEMKQIRLTNRQQERRRQQELLNAARMRKEKLRTSYENGRRRISQNYFQHLQTIKRAKIKEKQRKQRMTQKRCQELIKLQQREKEELWKYQQSLIMQSNLKEIIEKASNQPKSQRSYGEYINKFQ